MGKNVFHVAAGAFLLLICGDGAFCEDGTSARHLVIQFDDAGPPAVHQVEGKIGDGLKGDWAWVPANILWSDDAQLFQATLEMPDVPYAIFRIKRLAGGEVPGLGIVATSARPADGPVSPFDHAFIESCTNDDLKDLPRFSETQRYGETPYADMIPGVDYEPGGVLCAFTEDVLKDEAVAILDPGGVPYELNFIPMSPSVWCRVVSGDVWEHVHRLEESYIVRWAQWCGRTGRDGTWILVCFRLDTGQGEIRELLDSADGLEPEWETAFWGGGIRYCNLEVPPGSEFAWIMALEAHPKITYAELAVYAYLVH